MGACRMSNSKREMSFRHKWVLAVGQVHDVSEGARLLGIMAINQFGKPHKGAEFWPSHKALADLVGVTERTAQRRMDELVTMGLISKTTGGGRASNRYVATLPCADSRDGTTVSGNGDVVAAETPSADTGVAQEARSTATGDRGARTAVTGEQVQQHIHQEQIHAPCPPCFECSEDGTDCICNPPNEANKAPAAKPCGCAEYEGCAECYPRW
jgi:hypothetical protein